MEPILSVRNLSINFNGHKILESVSFDIAEGESLAILGPNGAGKTMLFKAILGLIPYKGEVIWRPGIKIGYIPQKIDFDHYLPLTLEDFLDAKAKIIGASKESINKSLETVGFSEKNLKAILGNFSFGQFQKALIAFSLIGNPEVLLLDEATLGVDTPYEVYIYEIIQKLQEERHLTIILISHEFEIVYKYTDKVLCLNKKMLCLGKPESALNEKTLSNLYKESIHYRHHH